MESNQDISNRHGQPFSYDVQEYDRRFLDCWRRQAVVLLEKNGADVNLLLYNALSSTDQIFRDHILNHKPKYAAQTPVLDNEGLKLIGWHQTSKTYENFAMAHADIVEHLKSVPFVIVMGSVFYLPHCPEYQKEHLNHSIVLTGQDIRTEWNIIDDDDASVLRTYQYGQSYISRYFDNNGCRMVRYFTPIKLNVDLCERRSAVIEHCAAWLSSMEDSYKMLSDMEWIANNPYESVGIRAKKLHEAFSVYSGSRSLFSSFVQRVIGDHVVADQFKEIANEAMLIKYAMVKAEITNHINVGPLTKRCEKLAVLERRALSSIKKILGCA